MKSQLRRGKRLMCHIFIKFFSVGWNSFYRFKYANKSIMNEMNNIINNCQMSIDKVGEVLTLLLHDVILNFISISKTAKTKVSATKWKKLICHIFIKFFSVGWNSFYPFKCANKNIMNEMNNIINNCQMSIVNCQLIK